MTEKVITQQRYCIEEESFGRYIIASAEDQERLWCGSHWGYADQGNGQLVSSFADRAAAEHYAKTILGER